MSPSRIRDLLQRWIADRASEEGVRWLTEKREEIAAGAPSRVFYTSFSAVPRYLGKADLKLSASEQERANDVRTGWKPASWSVDQAGRILLALSLPHDDPDAYRAELDRVYEHADVGESVALCLALPLLPHPEQHRERAAEGVRSNMTAVLAAVALRNPYPAEQFDDPAWNQMVLKAAFEGLPFREIHGLDDRANPTLARMLVDYAHERWAADRPVSPELWRPVGPFAEGTAVDDLARVLADGTPAKRMAAALALHDSPDERAEDLLSEHEDLRRRVAEGRLTWTDVAEAHATA